MTISRLTSLLRWLTPLALAAGLLTSARTALAALAITGVQPGTVSNATAAQLAITGTDFVTNTVVIVDGLGALDTTFVAASLLTAQLPAGAPPGVYTVRVLNPDGGAAALANALTISGGTATPQPSATPAPTAFARPQLVVISYGASSPQIAAGADYDFEMTLQKAGGSAATNIVAEFGGEDFLPRVTGGIRAVGALAPGGTNRLFQPLYAVREVAAKKVATLTVKVTYTNEAGSTFTDTFALTFPVVQPVGGGPTRTATPTATARPVVRPQLVVTGYRSDVEKLQPGSLFTLALDVSNVGNALARRVTLIVGGGSAPTTGDGTPGPGGVSGGSGSFTDFAPVQSSNVQSLGDLDSAGTLIAQQKLIVNASTKAGAYPLKLSFVYSDERGQSYVDDQVITLLVYQSPQVEISFYRDPGPMFAGQPNLLPVQVVNLGRNTTVLGNMKVTGASGLFSNNVLLVGALDPGGTFPLDASVIPDQPGPLELTVTIDFNDDFNQPQKITALLTVEVIDAGPPIDPGGEIPGGEAPGPVQESAWDSFLRFLRGLLGLGSGLQQTPAPGAPVEGVPGGPGGPIIEPGKGG